MLVRASVEYSEDREKEFEHQLIEELAHVSGILSEQIQLESYIRVI